MPPSGLACDLLWSDPEERPEGGWAMSARGNKKADVVTRLPFSGISLSFSERIVQNFCARQKIDLIVRGHQLTRDVSYHLLHLFDRL